MANNVQEEKVGDDINSESYEHVDPNVEKENRNEGAQDQSLAEKDVGKEDKAAKKGGRDEYYNKNDLQVWNNRCLRRNREMKEMGKKLADPQSIVHFMMQNNVM
ncbi:hypothetical protein ACSBR2_028848 [Camellia fascicularis]